MTLRQKLFLAQGPLVVALALASAGALFAAWRFGSAPGEILHENFRSFDAARSMLHSADAIDLHFLRVGLSDDPLSAAPVERAIEGFEEQLRLQRGNITEAGEREATLALERAWSAYESGLAYILTADDLDAHRARSHTLRDAVDRIVRMNRDAMRLRSERASLESRRIGTALAVTSVAAFALAVMISALWLGRILVPLRILTGAVQRLSSGDFDARIDVEGEDEIASLSVAFNEMAEHLAQYRASSLGELLDANNRLGSVMDSLADGVIVYDLEGSPIVFNEVATQLLGVDRLGLDTLPEQLQDAVGEAFTRVRETNEPYDPASLEAAVEMDASPVPRWFLVSATPIRRGGDVLSGVTVALRDVTRSRRIEGFKGDLVAAAAHELRTPLTSLHMAVHLCLEQAAGPLNDRQSRLLRDAQHDCERLQSVVEELLEMARLESGAHDLTRSNIDVDELLSDAAARHRAYARQQGVEIELEPRDDAAIVEGDYSRLRNAIDNLVANALVHARSGRVIRLGFEPHETHVRIHVDDAGPGVPPELRDRVFAKFFRAPGAPKRGSGLGLSIVRDVVHAHGGEVGVEESRLGGARFWFSIPQTSPSSSS